MGRALALIFVAVFAVCCVGGCDDQDAKPPAKTEKHRSTANASAAAGITAEWHRPGLASLWRFDPAPRMADSLGRIRAALDAGMLPPRDDVHLGALIDRVGRVPQPGPGGVPPADRGPDRGIAVSVVLTPPPWNENTILLWVAITGGAGAAEPRVVVEFDSRSLAAYRTLGDADAVPVTADGTIDASMLYELVPKAELAVDRSTRYATVHVTEGAGATLDRPVTAADMVEAIDDAPETLRFAAALAGFGALLRGDPAMRDLSCTDVIGLATSAAEPDPEGTRADLIGLMQRAEPLIDLPPTDDAGH